VIGPVIQQYTGQRLGFFDSVSQQYIGPSMSAMKGNRPPSSG
jgi:hypothetical protein